MSLFSEPESTAGAEDRNARDRLARSIRATKLGAALLITAILAISLGMILHSRTRELQESALALSSFDDLLAEQTARTFQNVSLVLDGVAEDLRPGLNRPEDLRRAGGRDVQERLQQDLSGVPQMDALSIVDRSGQLINFTRSWPIPAINVADRDYFRTLETAKAPAHALSAPVAARSTGKMVIYLARRLISRDGQFAGAVVAPMQLSYFQGFFKGLHLPPGSSIGLWRDDGTLLAHDPPPVRQAGPIARMLLSLSPGEGTNGRLGGQWVAGKRLFSQPVTVTVGRSLDMLLADWRLDAAVISLAALLGIAGVLIVAQLVIGQFRIYETAAAAMAARETAERELHAAQSRLMQGQKLEAIGRLTAGIAHDFNNLLTVVRANAELLGNAAPDPRSAKRIDTICHAADRGAALTRQMLAFSRQQILSPARLDLNATLGSVSELVRSSLGSRIRMEMRLSQGLWPAYADAAQLEQAILNLALNARDATPAGGTVRVETGNVAVSEVNATAQLAPGDYVAVTVADTGSGMTEDVASRAFDPFFTTKEQGKGTGLGLSQVVGFARQSGGDVLLNTAPERGTRISIVLPRAGASPAAMPAPAETRRHLASV